VTLRRTPLSVELEAKPIRNFGDQMMHARRLQNDRIVCIYGPAAVKNPTTTFTLHRKPEH